MWKIYFQTRLGIAAEDPDIFERVLDLLIQNYQILAPQKLSDELLLPLHEATLLQVEKRWSERYPELKGSQIPISPAQQERLANLIDEQWSKHGILWLQSFQTEDGSRSIELFRWLLMQYLPIWKERISANFATELQHTWGLETSMIELNPPEQKPGQTKAPFPKQPNISVQKFSANGTIPLRWFIALGLFCLILPLRKGKTGKLLFGLFLSLLVENISSLFIRPLIETNSYFSFNHWQVEPWQDEGNYLETQGSYIRAQRFQREKQGKRIIILGASSAHGSNHLWEDSVAGILEKKTNFEVINLAIGGTTSHGILHLLPYTLELEPDFIILYYGHNEVHQFEQLMEFHQSSIQTLWIKNVLWRSSTYSLLYRLLPSSKTKEAPAYSSGSAQQIQHSQVVTLAKWNHKQNISVLLKGYKAAEIPVILLNPPTNYPFAPVDERFLEYPAFSIPEKQAQIDQSLEATTIHSEIRKNNLELAQEFGLYYLDLDLYFHQESPDQLSANGLFWDELHPSALGQEWISAPLISLLNQKQ